MVPILSMVELGSGDAASTFVIVAAIARIKDILLPCVVFMFLTDQTVVSKQRVC